MATFKSSLKMTSIHFHRWKKDLRIIFVFVFVALLIDYYLEGMVQFCKYTDTKVTFCMLPSLFLYSAISIRAPKTMLYLGMIILLCDAPFFHPITPYAILRSRRKSWWMGGIGYIVSTTFLYMAFITIISSLCVLPVVTFENDWGSGLHLMVFGDGTQNGMEIIENANVEGFLLLQTDAVIYLYPFACQLYTFLTGWGTFIILGLLMYCISFVKRNIAWGMGIAGLVVFLEPVINWRMGQYPWLLKACPICWSTVSHLDFITRENILSLSFVIGMSVMWIIVFTVVSWLLSRKTMIELR